jgi:hypothetical protein
MVVVIVEVELACGCWRFAACFLLALRISLRTQGTYSIDTYRLI